MNKENNRSAAGLRPSAVIARIQIQKEWSALKGPESKPPLKSSSNLLSKKQITQKVGTAKSSGSSPRKESTRNMHLTNDILRGVVALVETGSEPRALPLRAALTALGASVLPAWSPLVTHLVWTQGGCRATRAKARALACRLVSPLWVEACAAAASRLPERAFPAVARASDLPSPGTLTRMLKRVEMENINITDLLSDSDDAQKLPRLRISTDTEQDTTNDTSRDTSHDTSKDTSRDTSKDTTADVEIRVNTAPRRALPKMSESMSPIRPAKSRRKLFTHKVTDEIEDDDSDETTAPNIKPTVLRPSIKQPTTKQPTTKQQTAKQPKTQCSRKDLARAERLAKKILAGRTQGAALNNTIRKSGLKPRIVLTGMSRSERQSAMETIKKLHGRVQSGVDKRTTHVVLGSCGINDADRTGFTGTTNISPTQSTKVRTYNALAGAARGCRVVRPSWVRGGGARGAWLHPSGHEVKHLDKIAQKARVERTALCKQRTEYAYDVFNGMRVRLCETTQCHAAKQLLALCGAFVFDDTHENDIVQNGGPTQNGGSTAVNTRIIRFNNQEYDIKIGNSVGDICSKWVFDSVAAGRMRTARRYVIKENSLNCELVTQMERMLC